MPQVRILSPGPRRRGLHVVRDDFFQKVISHSLRRSSFPNATRWGWARIWCLGVVSRVIRKLFYGLSGNRLQRRRP